MAIQPQHKLEKDNIIEVLKINERINHIRDVDSMLDSVLTEARAISNADAGSIYLIRDNMLSFEYVQNDTLMKNSSSSKRYLYSKQELPISNESISGYVALHKTHLVVDRKSVV